MYKYLREREREKEWRVRFVQPQNDSQHNMKHCQQQRHGNSESWNEDTCEQPALDTGVDFDEKNKREMHETERRSV